MNEPRIIKFGKYNGKSIIWLIAAHIGYIMIHFMGTNYFNGWMKAA